MLGPTAPVPGGEQVVRTLTPVAPTSSRRATASRSRARFAVAARSVSSTKTFTALVNGARRPSPPRRRPPPSRPVPSLAARGQRGRGRRLRQGKDRRGTARGQVALCEIPPGPFEGDDPVRPTVPEPDPACPGVHRADAVAPAHQVRDVDERPRHVAEEAGELHAERVGDGRAVADGGHRALVEILEGLGLPPVSRALISLPTYLPSCIAGCAMPGSLSSDTMSPIANTSGWPGTVQSGFTVMRPARSVSTPDRSASIFASGEACTPAAQIRVLVRIVSTPPGPSR